MLLEEFTAALQADDASISTISERQAKYIHQSESGVCGSSTSGLCLLCCIHTKVTAVFNSQLTQSAWFHQNISQFWRYNVSFAVSNRPAQSLSCFYQYCSDSSLAIFQILKKRRDASGWLFCASDCLNSGALSRKKTWRFYELHMKFAHFFSAILMMGLCLGKKTWHKKLKQCLDARKFFDEILDLRKYVFKKTARDIRILESEGTGKMELEIVNTMQNWNCAHVAKKVHVWEPPQRSCVRCDHFRS